MGLLSKFHLFSERDPAQLTVSDSSSVLFLRRAMNPAALAVIKCPGFHYADHRLEITKHDADYTNVEHQEFSKARHSPMA